jgi:Flp pilus assembly pilin Flp
MFRRYLKSKSGQGMSEYLILVVLIAVGSIAATKTLGATVKGKLEMINRQIDSEVLSPNSQSRGSGSSFAGGMLGGS